MTTFRPASLLAAALLASVTAHAAQEDSFELYRPLQAEAARFERESRLRDLFAEAGESAREAVLQLFEADRAANHVAWLPALSTLTAAEGVLVGRDGGVGPDLDADFLHALDLRPVPGLFAVRDGGKGEPITVHVESLYETPVPREFVLGLDWIAPDGSRYRARTEAFTADAFGAGLELYIRPPVSEASSWKLAPTLIVGERELRAAGVSVPCVAAFDDARNVLQAGGDGSRTEPHRVLWHDWTRLQDFGVRTTAAADLTERLAHFGLPGGSDWNHAFGWVSFGEGDALGAWGITPRGEVRGAVLMLTDGRRDESAVFAGALESRWAKFAEDRHSFVVSLAYTGDSDCRARLASVVAALHDQGVEGITFVAAGDAAVLLPAQLRELPPKSVGRVLVHSSPTVAKGVRMMLAAPVLGLAHGQSTGAAQRQEPDEASGEFERWWIRRRGPAILTELEAPELLGRWMDGSL
ncbi:MAG: hypothetical protein H6831_03655 [Planctomycetes bacterium]|nr:hypothetical protein [Planctomycetota bacterium]MCB9903481.1 hypothetical protein [Planctomycetota bacterium]